MATVRPAIEQRLAPAPGVRPRHAARIEQVLMPQGIDWLSSLRGQEVTFNIRTDGAWTNHRHSRALAKNRPYEREHVADGGHRRTCPPALLA